MKLYYFKDPKGNFGDDLNPWLWDQCFPDLLDEDETHLFVGVGTLLNYRIPQANRVTVFGSGVGYGALPDVNTNWEFYFVRGPLSAERLGLGPDQFITDPAILVSQVDQRKFDREYEVSYMPHCMSAALGNWEDVCKEAGINFIDPRWHYLDVFAAIKKTSLLLSEAMHGAIVADAFRVPWVAVKAYDYISDFKWDDWCKSMSVELEFNRISPVWRGEVGLPFMDKAKIRLKRALQLCHIWSESWDKPFPAKSSTKDFEATVNQLQYIQKNGKPFLSSNEIHGRCLEKINEKIEIFKKVYC